MMRPLLVLDTNVVLDWLIYHDPRVAVLAAAIQSQAVELGSDPQCLAELADVLSRPAIRASNAERQVALSRYRDAVKQIDPSEARPDLPQCRDPDDQKFVELAVRAQALAIVTRDKELLRMHHGMLHLAQLHVIEPSALAALLEAFSQRSQGRAAGAP